MPLFRQWFEPIQRIGFDCFDTMLLVVSDLENRWQPAVFLCEQVNG
jgi:hypothetical protein